MISTAGPISMNPRKETGPAKGTLILSLPASSELSGVNKESAQNAAVPTRVRKTRLTCAAVSSLALAIKSGGGLRRPRVTVDPPPGRLPLSLA